MVNGVKSSAATRRSSVTWKFFQIRRKKPTSTDTRGTTSCCTLAENSQLASRLPHPVSRSLSKVAAGTVVPKLALAIAPHSPLRTGLVRAQSGTKFRLLSVQLRVVLVTIAFTGLGLDPSRLSVCPRTSLLSTTFTPVLPLPPPSY